MPSSQYVIDALKIKITSTVKANFINTNHPNVIIIYVDLIGCK
jgi:hypothetical protein